MGELLQSTNDALGFLINAAGGYFDWITSSLGQDPIVTTVIAAIILGAWLFHRRDPSAP
jgi:Co/Zn/Cd efflux system component